jgi:hypothetical protein
MIITLASIAAFTGNTLSSYFAKKGLDIVLFSEPKFKEELNKTILETLEGYAHSFPQENDGKKFPFYHSQRVINELLNYRVMQEGDYNPNDLLAALQSEPNVIPPTTENIENFYKIFSTKIAANDKLKKLEIKQTFDKEIFTISKKLDDLQRNIEHILSSFTADLENQWKNRLDTYSNTIQQFKPTTALELLSALSTSLNEGSKKPTKEFLSLIEYQKGISLSFLDDKDATSKAYISAYRINESNTIFAEQAAMAYFKIGENASAIKIADDLLKADEFNSFAWAVKILTTSIDELQKELEKVPNIVKRDMNFKKLLFNSYTRTKRAGAIQVIYENGIVPAALEYTDIPVTVDTYSEHVFWMNLSINEYFSSFYLNFSDVDDRNPDLIKLLNNLIGKFLTVVKGTEIDKLNEELHFLYAYTNFILTKDVKYSLEMKDLFAKLKNKDYINLLLCANALQLSDKVQSAITLIEDNPSTNREVMMLQAFCYLQNREIEKYADTNRKLLNSTIDIGDNLLANHVNMIIQLRIFGKLQDFSVDDFTANKNFQSQNGESLTLTIASLLINGVTDDLMNELDLLVEIYKEDHIILGFIADAMHFAGKHEEAVKVFRMFLKKREESRDLLYYITSLYHTKKDSAELLDLLTSWRLNYQFQSSFLKTELQIRSELLDWKTCIEICKYFLSKDPDDEHVLVNYVIALYNENSLEANSDLRELIPKLRDYEYKSLLHVSTVSNILIRRKYFDDGIELLYRYAKLKENVELRKQYFTACVECSQGDKNEGPLKELDEAAEGTFVKYELNRNVFIIELTKENLKKEFYQAFLGARKSGGIVVKRPVTEIEDVLTIQRVMNKYLSLHDEILEQVHSDPHSGIGLTSITFEGGNIDSLNETFKSLFGAKGSMTKISVEEELKRYYGLELTFSQIVQSVFNGDYLGAYFHLVLQKDGLTTIPLIFLKSEIPDDVEYVLDITSVAMMFQIFKRHQVKFNVKFVVSKFIVDLIKRQLEEQNLESKSELSLSITTENITPHFVPEDQKDSNKAYLSELLLWIEDNCSIEISDRVLDFTRNIEYSTHEKPFIDYTLNTVLLVEDQANRVLVTDDTQYIKSGLVPMSKMVTSEYLAKEIISEDHPAHFEFIRNKYQGYTLTAEQLNTEYIKRLTSQPNYYNSSLENVNLFRNPNSAIPAILHVKEIALNQIILPDQFKNDVTAVFVSLLRGVDPEIRSNVELLVKLQCSLLGEKFLQIITSLRAAYLIIDES